MRITHTHTHTHQMNADTLIIRAQENQPDQYLFSSFTNHPPPSLWITINSIVNNSKMILWFDVVASHSIFCDVKPIIDAHAHTYQKCQLLNILSPFLISFWSSVRIRMKQTYARINTHCHYPFEISVRTFDFFHFDDIVFKIHEFRKITFAFMDEEKTRKIQIEHVKRIAFIYFFGLQSSSNLLIHRKKIVENKLVNKLVFIDAIASSYDIHFAGNLDCFLFSLYEGKKLIMITKYLHAYHIAMTV